MKFSNTNQNVLTGSVVGLLGGAAIGGAVSHFTGTDLVTCVTIGAGTGAVAGAVVGASATPTAAEELIEARELSKLSKKLDKKDKEKEFKRKAYEMAKSGGLV